MNADWLWWCLWVCFCLFCAVDAATDSTDAQVMAEMAKIVKVDSTWTGNDPCSGWTGVSCSETKVRWINIQRMSLEGTLPADFNKLSALNSISMQRTLLSGPLPSFRGLSNLQSVFLGSNAFDSIPADFFDGLTNLQTFVIDDNSLLAAWSIPAGLANAVALTSFSANNASIRGELPEFLGNGTMKGLLTLQLAYNYLNGSIPTSFKPSSFQAMWLNYQNGNLLGGIRVSMSLTGSIPSDLTNNQLSGAIPKFASRRGKLPSTGSSPPGASTGSSGSNNRPSSGSNAGGGGGGGGSGSKTWIAGIVIGVLALELVGGLCYCYASRKRQRSTRVQSPTTVATNPHRRGAPASSYQDQSKISIRPPISLMVSNMSNGGTSDGHVVEPLGNMVISIEVLREATDNFSDENILGRGGFGVVYRGELHDGTKIAAKRMKAAKMNSMGLREFQAEIAVLTKVRHRHLVGFLGYCIDGGEKVVVYEYMAHGPLSLHLFEWADAGLRPLEWKQRLTVALDVARGVEYLHSLAQTSFIHRDLKTSNILLDDNMRAKVSDFGLVRRVPDGKLSVETRLAGTFGYMPPEYAGNQAVTPVRLIN